MSKEIEIGAIVDDVAILKAKLLANGFQNCGSIDQMDVMMDYPDGRLFRSGEKIRIRTEGDIAELTYKGHFEGDASVSRRVEENVVISKDEVEKLMTIFTALGFPLLFRIPKTRERFTKGDIVVTFDEWPIIGIKMEIEGDEEDILTLAKEIAPNITFGAPRLKELFEKKVKETGKSLTILQEEYEKENEVKLGNLAALLK